MSADFTKILVKDDRLEVVDNIKYAVVKGGQNVTMSQFRAISATNSQLVFNIQVPSEQTIIDRRVLLSTDLCLTVKSQAVKWTAGNQPAVFEPYDKVGCGYGQYAGLASYPLHQMMTVASATINNNTVSINIRDVLPAIIRLLDKKELGSYNGMTVTQTDPCVSYSETIYSPRHPLAGTQASGLDTDYLGRGSIYLKDYFQVYETDDTCTETFLWHISEPLLLSPFIYCNPKSNSQGFYGIQNMNFVLNIGDTSRVFRGLDGVTGYTAGIPASSAGAFGATAGSSLPYITSVEPGGTYIKTGGSAVTYPLFSQDTALLFTFLTPHPSDLMPARNIVPYYELPRYITSTTAQSDPYTLVQTPGSSGFVCSPVVDIQGGQLYATQTLQLNQIPDKLIVWITKRDKKWGDSDSFLPIRKLSVQFNNNSGILSAARCEDIYRMAKDNGSNQSWNEWVGVEQSIVTAPVPLNSAADTPAGPVDVITEMAGMYSAGIPAPVFSAGSLLVLEFGKDIQLIEDFFAPGSLGNFNLQMNIYADNNNQSLAKGSPVNLYIVTMNSGVFVCERGTSSTYTGILTRADVLEASEQDAYTHSDVKRMVGGGFLDMLKSGVSKLAPLVKAIAPVVAPMAKDYLKSKGAMGKLASAGIGAMGYGMHAAGRSGAGTTGGALQGRYM